MIDPSVFSKEVEEEREIGRQRARRNYLVAGVMTVSFFILAGAASDPSMGSLIFAPITGLISLGIGELIYVGPKRRKFKEKVMEIINQQVFQVFFEDTRYARDEGFEQNDLVETGVIDFGNIYSSNDYLSGVYKGVDFERSDVLTQQRTSNGKTTTTTTLFQGQVYIFDFHKPTHNYIRIRNRGDIFSGFSKGRKTDGAKRMEFEDADFNERYYIYSNDEHEAFYVFTPHFMEKVKELDRFVQSPMSLVIQEGRLIIALYTHRDSFETSLFRGIDDQFIETMETDVTIISRIIDGLDLDSELFEIRES